MRSAICLSNQLLPVPEVLGVPLLTRNDICRLASTALVLSEVDGLCDAALPLDIMGAFIALDTHNTERSSASLIVRRLHSADLSRQLVRVDSGSEVHPLAAVLPGPPTAQQWREACRELAGRLLRGEAEHVTAEELRSVCERLAVLQRCAAELPAPGQPVDAARRTALERVLAAPVMDARTWELWRRELGKWRWDAELVAELSASGGPVEPQVERASEQSTTPQPPTPQQAQPCEKPHEGSVAEDCGAALVAGAADTPVEAAMQLMDSPVASAAACPGWVAGVAGPGPAGERPSMDEGTQGLKRCRDEDRPSDRSKDEEGPARGVDEDGPSCEQHRQTPGSVPEHEGRDAVARAGAGAGAGAGASDSGDQGCTAAAEVAVAGGPLPPTSLAAAVASPGSNQAGVNDSGVPQPCPGGAGARDGEKNADEEGPACKQRRCTTGNAADDEGRAEARNAERPEHGRSGELCSPARSPYTSRSSSPSGSPARRSDPCWRHRERSRSAHPSRSRSRSWSRSRRGSRQGHSRRHSASSSRSRSRSRSRDRSRSRSPGGRARSGSAYRGRRWASRSASPVRRGGRGQGVDSAFPDDRVLEAWAADVHRYLMSRPGHTAAAARLHDEGLGVQDEWLGQHRGAAAFLKSPAFLGLWTLSAVRPLSLTAIPGALEPWLERRRTGREREGEGHGNWATAEEWAEDVHRFLMSRHKHTATWTEVTRSGLDLPRAFRGYKGLIGFLYRYPDLWRMSDPNRPKHQPLELTAIPPGARRSRSREPSPKLAGNSGGPSTQPTEAWAEDVYRYLLTQPGLTAPLTQIKSSGLIPGSVVAYGLDTIKLFTSTPKCRDLWTVSWTSPGQASLVFTAIPGALQRRQLQSELEKAKESAQRAAARLAPAQASAGAAAGSGTGGGAGGGGGLTFTLAPGAGALAAALVTR